MNVRCKLTIMGFKFLHNLCEIPMVDRWKTEEVRCGFGVRKKSSRVVRKVLKWFGLVDRVSGELQTKECTSQKWLEEGKEAGLVGSG